MAKRNKKRNLTERERDACLAGLRLLLAWRSNELRSTCSDLDNNQVLDIACNGDRWPEPDSEFLDELCCALGSADGNNTSIRADEDVSLLEKIAKAAVEPKRRR